MPSVITSYVYTFAALVAVSALLIFSVNSYAYSLRAASEQDQLQSLVTGLAAKANEILTLIETTNASLTVNLNMPTTIGDQYYWLRISNDSSKACVEGALGEFRQDAAGFQVYIPSHAIMSGYFISANGIATLHGYMNTSTIQLNLASIGE